MFIYVKQPWHRVSYIDIFKVFFVIHVKAVCHSTHTDKLNCRYFYISRITLQTHTLLFNTNMRHLASLLLVQ